VRRERYVAVELAEQGFELAAGLDQGQCAAPGEALTSILIFLNKTYRVDGAGIKITGQLIMDGAGE